MNFKKSVLLIVCLSLLVKVLFLFASGSYANPKVFEYEVMARHLLDGSGMWIENFGSRFYAVEAPGFPVLCYVIYKLFGHHRLLIVLIQIGITSLLAVPVCLIARRIFDEKTSIIAGLLTALYPPLIIYSTSRLHAMNIYSFLFVLFIWSFLLLKDSVSPKNIVLVGCVSGLNVLFRITSITFFAIAIIWFYFSCGQTVWKRVRAIAFMALIFLVMISPWVIRNYFVFGRPLLFQTNKGESFWFGNIPGSKGSLYAEDGTAILHKYYNRLPPEFFRMGEIDKMKYLEKITFGYFKKDPKGFIVRIIKKAFYFWYFSPNQGTLYPESWMRLYKAYYLLILFPALFSVMYNFFIKKKDCTDAMLIGILLLAITMAHAVCFVEGRHRWSIEPLVLIFTADGLALVRSMFGKRTGHAG